MWARWRLLGTVFGRSLAAAYFHNALGIAKAAAYSALLSFFPVLASAAAILVQAKARFISNLIARYLAEVVPPGTENLVLHQFSVRGEHPVTLLVTAAILSIWAASSVIKSLLQGFQAAYQVQVRRSILRENLLALGLVVACALPLVAATLLLLFGRQLERILGPALDSSAGWRMLSMTARYAIAFGATASVTAMLYYFGPNRTQHWRRVFPGACLATVLWLLVTLGFGWYVRNMANYNVLYGSVGASIALLVWMYLLALIALVGCEFNAAWEQARS